MRSNGIGNLSEQVATMSDDAAKRRRRDGRTRSEGTLLNGTRRSDDRDDVDQLDKRKQQQTDDDQPAISHKSSANEKTSDFSV